MAVTLNAIAASFYVVEGFSDDRRDVIHSALNDLYSNPMIAQFINPSRFNLVQGTDNRIHIVPINDPLDARFYNPDAASNPSFGNNTVGLGYQIVDSGLSGFLSIDGSSIHESLTEILLHEILHPLLLPDNANDPFREEPVIFLENFLLGEEERNAHTGYAPGYNNSASAVEYLNGYTIDDHTTIRENSGLTTSYTYNFDFSLGDNSITKIYWGQNTNGVDHLITTFAQFSGTPIVDSTGNISVTAAESIVSNSTTAAADGKMALLSASASGLAEILDQLATSVAVNTPAWIEGFKETFTTNLQDSLLAVSAERMIDWSINPDAGFPDIFASGPVASGQAGLIGNTPPQAVTIDASSYSSEHGTIIFGVGGFTNNATGSWDQFYLDQTMDVIIGTDGNDVLFSGSGVSASGRNILEGGLGSDILFGAQPSVVDGILVENDGSISTLIGNAGENIYFSAAAADWIIGSNEATDIACYINSDEAISIDLRSTQNLVYQDAAGISHSAVACIGSGGDAEGDAYWKVDTFIGTNEDDVFYGSNVWEGWTTFIGGEGSDTFYLTAGTVAIGGEGADDFYITTGAAGYGTAAIIGLDADDRIWVDGVLYEGRTREIEIYNSDPSSTYGYWVERVISDESAYGPIYGAPSHPNFLGPQVTDVLRYDVLIPGINDDGNLDGSALLRFVDQTSGYSGLGIFIVGYEDGDAGLQYHYEYPDWDGPNATPWTPDIGIANIFEVEDTYADTPYPEYLASNYDWLGPVFPTGEVIA